MKRLVVGVLTALVGCGVGPVTPTWTAADYEAACSHLRAIHCPDGDPTPGGATCETVLADMVANGVRVDVGCLAQIPACGDESRCSR